MKLNDFYEIDDKKQNQFQKYMDLLLEWNEKMNLTAITEADDIILKHFVDSLTISKYIQPSAKIIDVGTGAGFPGIPIKIYDESINVTLMDSLNKRVNFLNEVIKELELNNIIAIHRRAEELGRNKDYRENFDVAVSRAVANFSTLLEYMLPFVKVGGKCICMKGPEVEEELEQGKNCLKILGAKIEKVEKFKLGGTEIKRSIVIVKKIRNTGNKYPRNAGIPSKKPL